MAKNDIAIFTQVDHGTAAAPITTGQSFVSGEPVVVVEAGTLTECSDDPAVVSGIAYGSSQGKDANGREGTVPDGKLVGFYKPGGGQLFRSSNFATDGAGTAVTPALTHRGDTAGFTFLSATDWVVDTGTANIHVEITDVLDAHGQSLGDSNVRTVGAGVEVIFGFL